MMMLRALSPIPEQSPIVDRSGLVVTFFRLRWQELQTFVAQGSMNICAAITTTGTINDLAPVTVSSGVLNLVPFNNATDAIVTGLAAGTLAAGTRVRFVSTGAGAVFFKHQSGGSLAGNRFTNVATSGDTPIAKGVAEYEYDGARWVLQQHEQGAWITPAFAAGNFTGSGGWTVDAGDVTTLAYRLSGKTLTVSWYIMTTTVITGTTLNINNGAWGGFVATKTVLNTALYNDNATGNAAGAAQVVAGGSAIQLLKAAGANWAAAVNATNVFGQLAFEVN